ncbi:hypothetical protein PHYBOEH_006492 [Phytophthora boehmeriae]|uniref:Uncharacterized protein n=1 Tax=Phytophthora boehmeriae TaxID=109152 RepID=A0A8T1WFT6_9STRA|nr:hypothetical protein PHYBOEH_006492 [Phytophthora boehmeriae]
MSDVEAENARLRNELAKRDRAEQEQLQEKLARTKKAKKELQTRLALAEASLAARDDGGVREKNYELKAALREKTEELGVANAEITRKTEELRTANAETARKTEELRTANAETARKTEELRTANAEVTRKTEELRTARADVAERFREVLAELRQQVAARDLALERKNTEIANVRGELERKNTEIERVRGEARTELAQVRGELGRTQERVIGLASGRDHIMAPTNLNKRHRFALLGKTVNQKRSIEMVSGQQSYVYDTVSKLTLAGPYTLVGEGTTTATASPIDFRNVVREKATAILKRKCDENPTVSRSVRHKGAAA